MQWPKEEYIAEDALSLQKGAAGLLSCKIHWLKENVPTAKNNVL